MVIRTMTSKKELDKLWIDRYYQHPNNKSTWIIRCNQEEITGFLSFWCIYCHKKHYHGRGEGYRTPHCTNPESMIAQKDYYLVSIQKNSHTLNDRR